MSVAASTSCFTVCFCVVVSIVEVMFYVAFVFVFVICNQSDSTPKIALKLLAIARQDQYERMLCIYIVGSMSSLRITANKP